MRWLADECVDAGLVSHLRAAGHDVLYMAEAVPSATDTTVVMRAETERRILLTADKDFGEFLFRWRHSVPAIVLLRIDPAMHTLTQLPLDAAIARFNDDLLWTICDY